ncbi:MAG: coenzyme F420-0:L-glutamate ligase [Candidatus Methanomethylicus sp.]|nr:coenzyme F420-0:L-glutamate ligase [Candidatus Methanomethylicus sp.]
MQVFGIKTPIIKPGDDIVTIALVSSQKQGLNIEDRDILVFSAKAIGAAQGRLVDTSKIKPSKEAMKISEKYHLDPPFAEVVLQESDQILGGVEFALATIKKGVLVANGGADQSNAPTGFVALWPEDPQKSAEELRQSFKKMNLDVGILIVDSRTLPLRMGNSAVAIGISGFSPVDDLRGEEDLFGRRMRIKRLAVADDLASAAQLVMGEASESTPIALIREAPVTYGEGYKIDSAFIPKEECLIMHLLDKY